MHNYIYWIWIALSIMKSVFSCHAFAAEGGQYCAIAWQQALPLAQVETDSASKQHGGIAWLQRPSDRTET